MAAEDFKNIYLRGPAYAGDSTVLDANLTPVGGMFELGNISGEFSFNTEVQEVMARETKTGRDHIINHFNTSPTLTLSMTFDRVGVDDLKQILFSTSTESAAGSVLAEKAIAPPVGRVVLLDRPATAVTSVTSDPTGTTYVAGTDYLFTAPNGLSFPASGSVSEDDPLLINYTALKTENHAGYAINQVERKVVFTGINRADGNRAVIVTINRWSLVPTQAFQLLNTGAEVNTYALTGKMLLDERIPTVDDQLYKVQRVVV